MDGDKVLTQGMIVKVPNLKAGHPLFIVEYDLHYVLDVDTEVFSKEFPS